MQTLPRDEPVVAQEDRHFQIVYVRRSLVRTTVVRVRSKQVQNMAADNWLGLQKVRTDRFVPSLWTTTDVVPGLRAREECAPVLRVRRKIPTFLLNIGNAWWKL